MVTPAASFLVLLVGMFVSRLVRESALKHLSADEKAAVVDAFSGARKYFLLGVVVVFAIGMYFPVVAVVLLPLYLVATATYTLHRLHELEVPWSFKRGQLIGMAISYSAVLAFWAMLFVVPR